MAIELLRFHLSAITIVFPRRRLYEREESESDEWSLPLPFLRDRS